MKHLVVALAVALAALGGYLFGQRGESPKESSSSGTGLRAGRDAPALEGSASGPAPTTAPAVALAPVQDPGGAHPDRVGRLGGGERAVIPAVTRDRGKVLTRIKDQEDPGGAGVPAWSESLRLVGDADLAAAGAEVLLARGRAAQTTPSFDGPLWEMTLRHLPDRDADELLLNTLTRGMNTLQRSLAMSAIRHEPSSEVRRRLEDELSGPLWMQAFQGLVQSGDEASLDLAMREWSKGGQRAVVFSRTIGSAMTGALAERLWRAGQANDILMGSYVVALGRADPGVASAVAANIREATRRVLPTTRPPSTSERRFAYFETLYALQSIARPIAEPAFLDFLVEEDAREESASILAPTIATMREALR